MKKQLTVRDVRNTADGQQALASPDLIYVSKRNFFDIINQYFSEYHETTSLCCWLYPPQTVTCATGGPVASSVCGGWDLQHRRKISFI